MYPVGLVRRLYVTQHMSTASGQWCVLSKGMWTFLKRLYSDVEALVVQKIIFFKKFEMLLLSQQEIWLWYTETSFFLVPFPVSEDNILAGKNNQWSNASGCYLHICCGKCQFVNLNEIPCSDYNHSYMKILTNSRFWLTNEIWAY